MNLTFAESAKGVNKDLNVTIMDICGDCKGSGTEPGTQPERCPQCNGTGAETVKQGPFMMRTTCRLCHGKGTHIKDPCKSCRGKGQVRVKKKIVVPVPAGIEDGQTVRMPVGKKEVYISFHVSSITRLRQE